MFIIIKSPSDFCILDEPFSNIAPIHVEKMQSLIREEKANKGIIVSDHLYEAIIQVSDNLSCSVTVTHSPSDQEKT